MTTFLLFIKNHWQLLIEISVTLITFVILILKKKVKVNDVMSGLFIVLPDFIKEAEKTGYTGNAKFTLVFSKCVNYLVSVTGLTSKEICDKYADLINTCIENILSTPTKKEVI